MINLLKILQYIIKKINHLIINIIILDYYANIIYINVRTHKDNEAYQILINKYGIQKDGEIYCKECGNYLDNVELSNFEGFSDDKPIIKESIKDEKEEIEFTELQEFIKLLGKTYWYNYK